MPAQVRQRLGLSERQEAVSVRRRLRAVLHQAGEGVPGAARSAPRTGAPDGQALQRQGGLHLRRGIPDSRARAGEF